MKKTKHQIDLATLLAGEESQLTGDHGLLGGTLSGLVTTSRHFEVTTGTAAADTLSGTNCHRDLIIGLDGDDALNGNGRRDTVFGGSGNDAINGGRGRDQLYGGDGNDTIDGGRGNDTLFGGAGDDHLYGGAGHDVIYGGTGIDTIEDGAGNDIVYAGDGFDIIIAGAGNDVFHLGQGRNYVQAGTGNDSYLGEDWFDTVDYRWMSGSLTLDLTAGTATIGTHQHTLVEIDQVLGTASNDIMLGSAAEQTLNGHDGNDTLRSFAGRDRLVGGAGNDVFEFAAADTVGGYDRIQDFTVGVDRLDVSALLNGRAVEDVLWLGDLGGDTMVWALLNGSWQTGNWVEVARLETVAISSIESLATLL